MIQSKKRKRLIFLYIITTPLAFFYLFVFPALVANQTFPLSKFGIGFAAFLYIQFWMLTAKYLYGSASHIYNLKRKTLFKFLDRPVKSKLSSKHRSFRATIIVCFVSYAFTLYGFAIFYTFLSHIDDNAFNVGKIGLFDSIYFSLITASTVGYGDVSPVTTIAKLGVMTEILIGLMYVIFFFSLVAGLLRDKTFALETSSNNGMDQDSE